MIANSGRQVSFCLTKVAFRDWRPSNSRATNVLRDAVRDHTPYKLREYDLTKRECDLREETDVTAGLARHSLISSARYFPSRRRK